MRWPALALAIAACGHPQPVARPGVPATPPPPSEAVAQPPPAPPPAATGDRVLLAVTGYSAERDDIRSADLARDVCSGAIAVVDAARGRAEAAFHCAPGRTIAELRDALGDAKTHVVVTDLDHATNQWKALRVDGVGFFQRPHDYPLHVDDSGAVPDFAPHLTHFIMTGVTAITRNTGVACEHHGVEWLTDNLRSEFTGADYVHISNEVSMVPDCTYPSKSQYSFCTKEHDFQALLDLHANIVELTGNHNRDFGDEPFRKTMDWYKAHDIATFGGGITPDLANEPIILPLADGKKLGIVGFNEACPLKECAKRRDEVGANAYDAAKARAAIAHLRDEGADFIIVTVQFREWDNAEPTPSQHKISHALVDAGADLVYGSQAHQLQHVEFYKGAPIFHGLGNLLFDQIHRVGVRQAFFLHHYFWNGKLVQSVPVFTFMADTRQPTLATPEQAAEMKAIIFRDDLLYR